MKNFMTLVKYELKKILTRKTAIISVVIMMLVMAFMASMDVLFSDETGKSGFEIMTEYREQSLHLNGRLVDNTLLREMRESFGERAKASDGTVDINAVLDDWSNPYRAIFTMVRSIVGSNGGAIEVDEDTLYKAWEAYNVNRWDTYRLTEGEKEYWREKLTEVERPFTYYYNYGSSKSMVEFYTCSILMLLMVTVSLSAVFSDEYSKGMDKLIMSTRKGKGITYFAKLTAGMIFAFVGAILLILSGIIPTLMFYGAEGMDAAVQLYMETSPFNMTIGNVLCIFMVIYMITALLYAVLTMLFSQVFRSSITSMGIMIGFLIFMMCVTVPENFRVLSQLFDLLPANVLAVWSLFDVRLVPFFGGYLTNLQVAPVAYVLLTLVLIGIGKLVQMRRENVKVSK
ncbi:MAG: hypothetical protein J6B39_02870 [Lachnospiraceae bacterium]|nr:hypothetical protein [Lachnospiraceae bacterium]